VCAQLVREMCPYCGRLVVEIADAAAKIRCSQCLRLFWGPKHRKAPYWILGVLLLLVTNLIRLA